MKVKRQEFRDKLGGRRGIYSEFFVDKLYEDLADFGWAVFDETALVEKLNRLEANIREDITTSPEIWIERFKNEILLKEE